MKDTFVTFGEIMMRLNPEGYLRLRQADRFEVSFAGGEANVAASLACFGKKTEFVTKLPDNELGMSVIDNLRKYGVGCSHIVTGGPRLGVYFVEKGASQRPSKVIYDRAGSSIALAKREDFDWDAIFADAKWFHITGITPALGGELPGICLEALTAAKEKGVTVSCDLNYRKKLWSKEAAGKTMRRLMPYVDVCIANEQDAADVFGIRAAHTDVEKGLLDYDAYAQVAGQIADTFGCRQVAVTLRGSISASENTWAGMLYENGKAYYSRQYDMKIVDRVGGGDSFAGALIYALSEDFSAQEAVAFAAAASCLKHSIEHDFNLVTVQEVMALMTGDGSGRVQR